MTNREAFITGLILFGAGLFPLWPTPKPPPAARLAAALIHHASPAGLYLPCGDRPAGWFLRDGERVERCSRGHEFVTVEGRLAPAY